MNAIAQAAATVANPITCTLDFEQDGVQHGFLKLPYSRDDSAWGAVMIPLTVVRNGNGPTALLTGGNHGDEYEGPVALSKLAQQLQPEQPRHVLLAREQLVELRDHLLVLVRRHLVVLPPQRNINLPIPLLVRHHGVLPARRRAHRLIPPTAHYGPGRTPHGFRAGTVLLVGILLYATTAAINFDRSPPWAASMIRWKPSTKPFACGRPGGM